jgi:hypothetical protein
MALRLRNGLVAVVARVGDGREPQLRAVECWVSVVRKARDECPGLLGHLLARRWCELRCAKLALQRLDPGADGVKAAVDVSQVVGLVDLSGRVGRSTAPRGSSGEAGSLARRRTACAARAPSGR